jgi:hypothetical protein
MAHTTPGSIAAEKDEFPAIDLTGPEFAYR